MNRPSSAETRSIGEVLAILKQEFDDITISKIRFLEGQGLIAPERTASGYRKFTDDDVERLRYILRAQKDQFLPLKVIKGRLKEQEQRNDRPEEIQSEGRDSARVVVDVSTGAVAIDRTELAGASGLSESQLRELEGFGFVRGRKTLSGLSYDDGALTVAKLAARLLQYGVEPRHLRIFKTAAEREADLYRQLAGPVLTSRNTQARMDAVARLEELQELGEALRSQLLREALES